MRGSENHSDCPSDVPLKTRTRTTPIQQHYIGRFAPSPTGPLHFGSLIAATASYLCARQNNGQWLLRMEDVDTQREQKGASQSIIQTLESYGFEWDGEIRFQSQHNDDYEAALEALRELTYPCSCTRKSLQNAQSTRIGKYGYIYPGFCRNGMATNTSKNTFKKPKNRGCVLVEPPHSIRIRSDNKHCNSNTQFKELCQPAPLKQDIEREVGDFILKRSDGLFAYQLAVIVDDELQGITDIVRGADLFDNTPRQIYLQCLLGFKHPQYLHFPVAVDSAGKKLSKQNLSPEISADKKRKNIINTLHFLGQNPPNLSDFSNIDDLWKWAVQNWDHQKIPKVLTADTIT